MGAARPESRRGRPAGQPHLFFTTQAGVGHPASLPTSSRFILPVGRPLFTLLQVGWAGVAAKGGRGQGMKCRTSEKSVANHYYLTESWSSPQEKKKKKTTTLLDACISLISFFPTSFPPLNIASSLINCVSTSSVFLSPESFL